MKKILLAILLLIGFVGHSQIYTPVTVTIYGTHDNRLKLDSVILLPSGCGRSSHLKYHSTDTLHMALYGDTCNHRAYLWFPGIGWEYIVDSLASSGLYVRIADTSAMLANRLKISDTATALSNRLKISDTTTMLNPYAKTALVNNKVNITDTSAMLGNYLRKTDTSTMLSPYLRSFNALSTYLKLSDTSTAFSKLTIDRVLANGSFSGRDVTVGNISVLSLNMLYNGYTMNFSMDGAPSTNHFITFPSKDGNVMYAGDTTAMLVPYVRHGGIPLTAGTATYAVSAGDFISNIYFSNSTTITVSVGTSAGAHDVVPSFSTNSLVCINQYFPTSGTLYFNGATGSTLITIYKL